MDSNPEQMVKDQKAKYEAEEADKLAQAEEDNLNNYTEMWHNKALQNRKDSVLDILSALNKARNVNGMSDEFKKKLNEGTVGTELIAVVFYKVQSIINNSPHDNKITQEQAAAAFHRIRGLFSVISNN